MTTIAPSVDARIAASTTSGFPVTTRGSMREAGVHRTAIARRIEDGRLVELWPDTFLIGGTVEDAPPDYVRAAAVMAAGPGSALDGTSALHRRGLWARHDGSIHVVAPRSHRNVPDHRVTFHRAQRITYGTVDGIRTRDAVEALFAAGLELTPHQLAHVIERGQYEGQLSTSDIQAALDGGVPRYGAAAVRRAVVLRSAGSEGTKGRTEDRLLPHVTSALGEPLVNVRGAAGIPDYQPDFCWKVPRWIVEVDGGHHLDPFIRATDEHRDSLLALAGWTVVRIWWRDVWRDIDAVMRRIIDELRFAGTSKR